MRSLFQILICLLIVLPSRLRAATDEARFGCPSLSKSSDVVVFCASERTNNAWWTHVSMYAPARERYSRLITMKGGQSDLCMSSNLIAVSTISLGGSQSISEVSNRFAIDVYRKQTDIWIHLGRRTGARSPLFTGKPGEIMFVDMTAQTDRLAIWDIAKGPEEGTTWLNKAPAPTLMSRVLKIPDANAYAFFRRPERTEKFLSSLNLCAVDGNGEPTVEMLAEGASLGRPFSDAWGRWVFYLDAKLQHRIALMRLSLGDDHLLATAMVFPEPAPEEIYGVALDGKAIVYYNDKAKSIECADMQSGDVMWRMPSEKCMMNALSRTTQWSLDRRLLAIMYRRGFLRLIDVRNGSSDDVDVTKALLTTTTRQLK